MYKLLLVDDEPRQVRALANIINQLRPEYQVSTACDGQEAYDLLSNNHFDILFTDIRMPNMDGLQLIEKLFVSGTALKIVILSGYGEFEYAQKAIRYGVNDYLVKPISKTDLQGILNKVENALELEKAAKAQEEELKKKLDSSLPVYFEHQLNKWISGKINEMELKEIESIFLYKGYGLVLVTAFKYIDEWTEDLKAEFIQYAKFSIREILTGMGHSISFMSEKEKRQMVTVIVSSNPINYQSNDSIKRMQQYIGNINDKYGVTATIGVGERTENIFGDVQKAFQSAQVALESRFFSGLGKVVFGTKTSTGLSFAPYEVNKIEGEISEAIRNKDKMRVSKITSDVFGDIKNKCNVDPEQFKENMSHLLLNQLKDVHSLIDSDSYIALVNEIKRKLQMCEEYSEFWHLINDTLYKIIDISDEKLNDKNGVLINKCKKFIDENYMEDISLEVIAQKYYFNPSYFSNLFKSYMGLGFSEYLLKVRIQNAIRLLTGSEDSMSDVSVKVGFKDPTYFNRVFKREIGISPLKYRQMNRK